MAEWTTEDVRHFASVRSVGPKSLSRYYGHQFDRWLDAHEAAVRAQALRDAADELGSTDSAGNNDGVKDWLYSRADREAEGGAR